MTILTPSSEDKNAFVSAHNQYRIEVDTPTIHWDDNLATAAETWAGEQIDGVFMKPAHASLDERQSAGENLSYGWFSKTDAIEAKLKPIWQAAVDNWGDEKTNFEKLVTAYGGPIKAENYFKRNGFMSDGKGVQYDPPIGHYTQVVWRTSTKVGAGLAYKETKNSTGTDVIYYLVVARYLEAGNMKGDLPYNLLTGDWSFESVNYPKRYIRHQNFLGVLTEVSSELDKKDSTFKIISGKADPTAITFEAVNFPGYYLQQHSDFRIHLVKGDDSEQFKKDATFWPEAGSADSNKASFKSYNYPDRFIRHRNFQLWIESGDDNLFKKDSTFTIVTPNWPLSGG